MTDTGWPTLALQTEYSFTLPRGFVDSGGTLHREGKMRLATAADEIEPLRDPRVRENEAYLTVVVLSRVISRLGSVSTITPRVVESLFASDLAYLQNFYSIVNFGNEEQIESLLSGGDPPLGDSLPPDSVPETEPGSEEG